MILDAISLKMILRNLAPVEALRPGALMTMAESKPVLPTPSERDCVCVCVCVIGRASVLGVEGFGKFQVEVHEVQERKQKHRKKWFIRNLLFISQRVVAWFCYLQTFK